MAYTKILVIKSRLDVRVNYAINEEKTSLDFSLQYALNGEKTSDDKILYESTIHCIKGSAYQNMMKVKKRHHKEGGVLGYHIIQSFKPDEVTPEQAHEIGVEFARKCFGDKYQSVIGTHLDRAHYHNHIVINSVSLIDGKKYRNDFKDYFRDIRGISDGLCKQYGLSVIKEYETDKSLTYIEWLARQKLRTSWQTIIRADIDDCIKQAFNYGNFIILMENKGYEIKQGIYLSFRPYGKERFSRGYKLGEEYSQDNIRNRIEGKDLKLELSEVRNYAKRKQNSLYPKGEVKGLKALYAHYLYLMGLVKKNELPDGAAFVIKEDLLRFERMTKTYQFITDRNLDTVEQVEDYKAKCYQTIEMLKEDQLKSKNISRKKEKLYKALTIVRNLEKPHQLFLDGFTEMKREHNEYLEAFEVLKSAGYKTEQQLSELEKEKSDITDIIARNANHIRHFKYEIRMCNNALAENEQVEKKIRQVEQQREATKQRKENQHEPSKR